jgi:signal peptidase II
VKRLSALSSLCLIVVVLLIDRISKTWALGLGSRSYTLMPGLTAELTFNKGVSWGLLSTQSWLGQLLLMVLLVAVIGALSWQSYKRWQQKKSILGELLVIAGALGNCWDRISYGAVVDFIFIHYKGWGFPALFNGADVAIVGGVCLLFLAYWREYGELSLL